MRAARNRQHKLADEIVGRLARRHSTAVVLFHHVVAERLGLGPTDHKCLDLLRERGAMAGSDLGGITGLTSGAITGVVARLERAGYLRREPDPHDGRKQILHLALELAHVQDVIGPLRKDVAALRSCVSRRRGYRPVEKTEAEEKTKLSNGGSSSVPFASRACGHPR